MNQNKIWDFFQNQQEHSFDGSINRIKYLVKRVPEHSKVLNIGAGGALFEKLVLLKNGVEVYTLDPSEKTIQKIKSIIGDERAKVGYAQKIPFDDDSFDVVVMTEVLEHLKEDVLIESLKEVHRVLKDGGRFIGTVPYRENLDEQIVVCPNCGDVFHRWGHVQSFDEKKLQNLLSVYFETISLRPKLFIPWGILNWKGKIAAIFDYIFYIIKIKKRGLNLFFEGIKH